MLLQFSVLGYGPEPLTRDSPLGTGDSGLSGESRIGKHGPQIVRAIIDTAPAHSYLLWHTGKDRDHLSESQKVIASGPGSIRPRFDFGRVVCARFCAALL